MKPEECVRGLLDWLDPDPDREGLEDTPRRVVDALVEMTAGYREDPKAILERTFDVPYDEMVVVTDIEFTSLCEHHLLPFVGTASIGYLPGARVVGLSKLARLVLCFARRLQVQERMTQQIAGAIQKYLGPEGVGVIVRAEHACMACRGVERRAPMITSAMLGSFREKPEARAEFLTLAGVR